ncbi:MAG: RHS repeat protein [Planctomycetes bacterium]|nr:RHS repeat protein [Planctomycetota bacterium]
MKHLLTLVGALALCGPLRAQTYSYDGLQRLTRVEFEDGRVQQLTYDASGNVTRKFTGPAASGGGGGGGCFIATAAYGSALDPHVETLRSFREEWLRPYALGRLVIASYERVSPPLAAWIGEREDARTATRWALAPLVLGAAHPRSTGALLAALALAFWARRRSRRGASALRT